MKQDCGIYSPLIINFFYRDTAWWCRGLTLSPHSKKVLCSRALLWGVYVFFLCELALVLFGYSCFLAQSKDRRISSTGCLKLLIGVNGCVNFYPADVLVVEWSSVSLWFCSKSAGIGSVFFFYEWLIDLLSNSVHAIQHNSVLL